MKRLAGVLLLFCAGWASDYPSVFPVCSEEPGRVCASLLESYPPDARMDPWEGRATCLEVASLAEQKGAPVPLAVALAYRESTLNPSQRSRAGALGALQVIPRYWCPEGCHLTEAGIEALLYWIRHSRDIEHAIARYNAGWNPGPASWEWSKERVLPLARRLQ